MEIRDASPEDSEALDALDEQTTRFLRRFYRPNAAAIANRARIESRIRRLVAVENGEVVGAVGCYRDGSFLRILGLGVRESHRRRGVARALVDRALELAGETDCRAVRLFTVAKTGNVPIFTRLGFAVVGESRDGFLETPSGEPVTDVEMEKRLSSPRGRTGPNPE